MEKDILPQFGSRQKKAIELVNFLYSQPFVTVNAIVKELKINYAAANRMVNDLAEKKVLKDLSFGSKERWFLFEEYVGLFMKEPGFKKVENNNEKK